MTAANAESDREPSSRSQERPAVTVVICTRNPQPALLRRAIHALASQSLPADQWNLIVVDNGSAPPVALPDLPGLPPCRVVIENTPGLTHARLRGIAEAEGELLVFVDDDNLLAEDYLSEAVSLMSRRPDLGACSGNVRPEFEAPPPDWMGPFWSHLALAEVDTDAWSNRPYPHDVLPVGAGLCIRRHLARAYAEQLREDPLRQSLDRADGSTASGGDTDMALTCIDQGFATGRFAALRLTHVIPKERLQFDYQRQLARGLGYSYGWLLARRGGIRLPDRIRVRLRTLKAWLGLKYRGKQRAIDLDYHRGFLAGLASGRGA